ncbi:MAG TPA: PEP/pyruvate-binding domain-containing protein, partial [Acidimicrobiia bacterium]
MTGNAVETWKAALVGLDDPAADNSALVGNKAATLAMLRRAGFEVPAGVVIPATALIGASEDLPPFVRAGLAKVPELMGSGPWAVRSSNTAEDSEQASFAGQFETILEVDEVGLAEAVLSCWKSGQRDRVKAYAGLQGLGSMAVLIQPMIEAEAAGVAFTIDPVTGRHHVVVEAVAGLGEQLVSGAATPERWTIEEDESIVSPTEATVLDADQARTVGDLAKRVEEHLGHPQDVEWAIARGSLWLLQARPITTLTTPELIPIPIDVPPGYWERDNFHEPVPISPFGKVVLTEQILKVFPRAFAEFGILLERAEAAFIGGWMYRQVVPVGAPPSGRARTGSPPGWLMTVLLRVHPGIRRRIRAARQAMASDLPDTVIRRWNEEWRPEHQQEIAHALAVDLGSLSDQELAAQLDHRIEVLSHPAHVVVAIAYWIQVYQLAETCRELLGWDTAKMLALLDGLSTISTEPARQLAHLAELARSNPAIRQLLARVDETTPGRLAEVDPGFARAFSDYVQANGHRSLRYDVIEPTLAETPHVLLRLVADQLEVGFSPD